MTEATIVPITYSEVINAARALESEGIRLTILAVRERIGRGSFSTVKKFLERWNEERETRGTSSQAAPLPASLGTLWTEACKQAEESVAQERAALDQLASDLEARFEQLRGEAIASDTRRAQAEQRLTDLQKILERSQADVEELKSQRSELEQRLYGALEMAAQERHGLLTASAENLQQAHQLLQRLVTVVQQQTPIWEAAQNFAEEVPHQLRQLESRLNESAAADRQRIAEQDEHWRLALAPLSATALNVEALLRVAKQRPRPTPRQSRESATGVGLRRQHTDTRRHPKLR